MTVSRILDSHITIGTLIESGSTIRTSRSSIEAWPGYGVVCYSLGTLNGSIPAIAASLVAMVKGQEQERKELGDPDYRVTVILDGEEETCFSVDSTLIRLTQLYQSASQTACK